MVLSGCFQPFRLENEWPCVLLCQMFPPVPETSVVYVVVMDQASPKYPARLDWYLWFDHNSGCRVRQRLSAPGDRKACYAIIKDKAAAPLSDSPRIECFKAFLSRVSSQTGSPMTAKAL